MDRGAKARLVRHFTGRWYTIRRSDQGAIMVFTRHRLPHDTTLDVLQSSHLIDARAPHVVRIFLSNITPYYYPHAVLGRTT
jgi:hypothetical protein